MKHVVFWFSSPSLFPDYFKYYLYWILPLKDIEELPTDYIIRKTLSPSGPGIIFNQTNCLHVFEDMNYELLLWNKPGILINMFVKFYY